MPEHQRFKKLANTSKAKAIELIYIEMEKGMKHNDAKAYFMPKLGLSKETFRSYWNSAKVKYAKRQEKTEQAIFEKETNKVLHILETQDGQVNALIEQLNEVKAELQSGTTIDCAWNRGEFVETVRPLNATERKDRRLLYYKLLAEIRSIRGLDAPKQSQVKLETDIDKLINSGDAKVEEGEGPAKPFKNLKGE